MRLAQLDLRAYGHFGDFALDFGDGSGLHLIYGDNEAGKSTTLRALGSLLFGYPHQAVDAFIHQPRDIVLGGRLIGADGRAVDLVRRRTGRNPLVEASGAPLAEAVVGRLLGGIGRELFERVFALDHRRLREHARSLLADGGALGYSLAEAGAGIAGLKASLDGLRDERETLFLERGQRVINQHIKHLAELRAQARQLAVSPESYRKLSLGIEEERAKLDALRRRRQTVAAEVSRLDRLTRNLPRAAQRREKLTARAALGDFALLPLSAAEQRARAEAAREAAERQLAEARGEAAAARQQIAAISVDETVLAHAEDIARLAEWRGKILHGNDDLPRREASLRERSAAAAALMHDAGLGDAVDRLGKALPIALKRQRVKRLAAQGAQLATRAEERRGSLEIAGRSLKAAVARLAAAPSPADIGTLAQAVEAAVRLGDVSGQIARRRLMVSRAAQLLETRVRALGIAGGSVEVLSTLPLPSAGAAQAAAKRLAAIEADIAALDRELGQLEDEEAVVRRELGALAATGSPPSEEALIRARGERDRGWALVRGIHLEGRDDLADAARSYAAELPLPDAFAARVIEADRVVDALRHDAARTARHAELIRRARDIKARIATLQGRRTIVRETHRETTTSWTDLWCRSGLPLLPPGEASEWLAKTAGILADVPAFDAASEELRVLEEREQSAQAGLAAAIADQGGVAVEGSIETVLGAARGLLDSAHRHSAERDRLQLGVADAQRAREGAERLWHAQEAATEAWRDSWQSAVADIGLAPDTPPEEADAFIEVLAKLDEHFGAIADLRHRIETMRRDKARFDAFVTALAAAALPGRTSSDMVEVSRGLERHLSQTSEENQQLRDLRQRLDAASRRESDAEKVIAAQDAVLRRLCDLAGGVTPAELAAVEERSARCRALDAEIAAIELALVEDGAGGSLDAVCAESAGVDGDTVRAALADASGLLKELEEQEPILIRELTTRENALEERLAREQAAAVDQDAALEAAALAEEVERYVGVALEETLLRAAIELYRERNQDPILTRASAIFAELTEGVYHGLRSDVDGKGNPVVLAQDANGGTLEVEALSDGTLDQLYLALRLAVIQEHNAGHEPMPFVADDLLINFDDRRAAAALRVLAAGTTTTQVLLFTHHAHLAALARRAVPGDVLHEHRLPRAVALAA